MGNIQALLDRFKILYYFLIVLVPSLVFFVATVSGVYLVSFIAFLFSSLDIAHRIFIENHNEENLFKFAIDNVARRLSEILFISSFGFAGLSSWVLVVPIIVLTLLVNNMRTVVDAKISKCAEDFERLGRFVIIFIAFLLVFLFPGFRILSFSVSDLTLTILLIYTFVLLLFELQNNLKNI